MSVQLEAISNHVLFEFVDRVGGREIFDKTKSGIIISGSTADLQRKDRWGLVISVGPEAKAYVSEGEYVLIETLQWTNGVEVGGKTYWKTDITKVMAVSDEPALL
jgi:co-chaperonin GroES (HSP10)